MQRSVFVDVALRHVLRKRKRHVSTRETTTIDVSPIRYAHMFCVLCFVLCTLLLVRYVLPRTKNKVQRSAQILRKARTNTANPIAPPPSVRIHSLSGLGRPNNLRHITMPLFQPSS